MTTLVIAAALISIAITGILTFVLWRMNQPMLERNKQDGGGGDGAAPVFGGDGRHDDGGSDVGGDGGGGDGGGD